MLPILYHTHHSAHSEDLPFWLGLARQQGGPLLELGCGTGRVSIPLARAGFQVVGIDNDPGMLACLQANCQAAGLEAAQLRFFQADMTHFDLGQQFPLVLLPCNTFSTLESPARQAVLACVLAHLQPGGLFAVSQPNPALFYDLPKRSAEQLEEDFTHPLSGNPVQVLSSWRRSNTQFVVTWHYDHLLPNGKVERTSAVVRHTLDSAEVYVREIAAAGLEIQAIYGDFERHDYDPEGDEMIVVARRV